MSELVIGIDIGTGSSKGVLCDTDGNLIHSETDTTWNSAVREIAPNPDNAELYSEMFRIYLDLYPATAAMSHKLTDIQARL